MDKRKSRTDGSKRHPGGAQGCGESDSKTGAKDGGDDELRASFRGDVGKILPFGEGVVDGRARGGGGEETDVFADVS
eukprot:evm.model.NODE_37843_length_25257_cov_25.510313.5